MGTFFNFKIGIFIYGLLFACADKPYKCARQIFIRAEACVLYACSDVYCNSLYYKIPDKNKLNIELFAIFAGTVLVLVTASLTGKLVFITKYSIEIYPILIFLACSGLTSINNKIIKNSLIIIYCFISVGYIILHPYSAPKMRRAEGHKIMTDILTRMDLKKMT